MTRDGEAGPKAGPDTLHPQHSRAAVPGKAPGDIEAGCRRANALAAMELYRRPWPSNLARTRAMQASGRLCDEAYFARLARWPR